MLRHSIVCTTVLLVLFAGCTGITPPRNARMITRRMTVTGYCACGKCCGWERTWTGRAVYSSGRNKGRPKKVGITASGVKARHGTIAADKRYPFGTVMHVPGYGYGRVEDRGGAMKGERIDLYFRTHQEALEWGKQTKTVRVWIDD